MLIPLHNHPVHVSEAAARPAPRDGECRPILIAHWKRCAGRASDPRSQPRLRLQGCGETVGGTVRLCHDPTIMKALHLLPAVLTSLLRLAEATPAAEVKLERVPEGGVQPQVCVSGDGSVHLVYLKGDAKGADVRYVHRGAGAGGWSRPVTVNSVPRSAVAAGTIRGAQLAAGPGGRLHVVWNGAAENGAPATAPLYYTQLKGDSFLPQRTLNAGTLHLDGGASITTNHRGGVFVVWHAAPPEGKGEAERRIYLCRSTDHGATFSPAVPAEGALPGVCACCSLKTTMGADGILRILYRSAVTAAQRDMTLLESQNDGASFSARLVDPWEVAACPMSSATMVSDGLKTLAAWETAGIIRVAALGSALKPQPLSEGKARHPALAVNARGEMLATWSVGTGWQKGGSLAWRLLDASGAAGPGRGSIEGVPVWSHTAAYATPDGNFVVLY